MDLEINYQVHKIRQLNPALNQFIQVHARTLTSLKYLLLYYPPNIYKVQHVVPCHQFFLTTILGPLLSSLRVYFRALFPKSNLIVEKKIMFFIVSFPSSSILRLCPNVLVSPFLMHTEYVLVFDTKYTKKIRS